MSLSRAISLSRATLPAFVAVGVFWGAFAAYVPVLKARIGASDEAFGMVLLVGALGAVSAMWLAPRFDARAGRLAMAGAALLLGLAFAGPARAEGLVAFALLMGLVGAASGLLDVVMNARLSLIENARGASLMNLNHAVFSFAYAGAAMGSGLAREAGWPPQTVFTMLLVLVLAMTPAMVQGRDGGASAGPGGAGANPAFPPVVIWGGLIILVAFLSEQAAESWSALHVERELGGGAAEGAFGPAALGLTMGVGRLAGQLVVARISEARVVFWAALVSAAGAGLVVIAQEPALAYLGFATLGLGVSVIAPMVLALVGRRVGDADRARAISRTAVIGYCGFFIGPPMIGFIAGAFGLRAGFGAVLLLILAIPLLLRRLR